MPLPNRRKTIAFIIVWSIVLSAAWFTTPHTLRWAVRFAQSAPNRQVYAQISEETRAQTKTELNRLLREYESRKIKGDTSALGSLLLELGIQYETLGALWKAEPYLSRATRREQANASAWEHLARVREGLSFYTEAADAWRAAIERAPKNPSHYARLAYLFDKRINDSFTANGVYLEGLARSGNTPELMRSYALFLERIEDNTTALLYWKALLEKEPNNKEIQERITNTENGS